MPILSLFELLGDFVSHFGPPYCQVQKAKCTYEEGIGPFVCHWPLMLAALVQIPMGLESAHFHDYQLTKVI